MSKCASTCGHYRIVNDYRQERERQEIVADDATNGYLYEYDEYLKEHPLINFKQWLIQNRRSTE